MNKGTIYTLKELSENLNLKKTIILYHIEKGNLKADKVSHVKYQVQPEDIKSFLTKRKEERKCSECIYHSPTHCFGTLDNRGCWYMNMTGKQRGCPPINCKRFKRRAKK